MKDILRSSLVSLYQDLPEVVDLINQLNFQVVEYKFRKELFARIDEATYNKVDLFMRSDEVLLYQNSITAATLAVTRELSQMLDLVIAENQSKEKH